MASEVCLIDHDANKASAEAEDIQHVGFFLGCPLVTGTSGTRQPRLYIYFYFEYFDLDAFEYEHASFTKFKTLDDSFRVERWKWKIREGNSKFQKCFRRRATGRRQRSPLPKGERREE